MSLDIDRLTDDDVGDAQRLSTQVGWNQTKADWRRLLELFPDTCFAGHVDGELVATSTLATYGDAVGWIGMVLVDEDHRRRGYGGKIFERALDAGFERDLDVVGLDATDAGREVYRRYGFETVVGIDRWTGSVATAANDGDDVDIGTIDELDAVDEIAPFDRRHSGVDRRALLEHFVDARGSTGLRRERDGSLRGYATVRPGRTHEHVGPLVAVDRSDAAALLEGVADRVDDTVVVDALRGDRTGSLLERFGLDVQRRLHRMTHDEPRSILDGAAVDAAAGFEWG